MKKKFQKKVQKAALAGQLGQRFASQDSPDDTQIMAIFTLFSYFDQIWN